MRQVPQYTVTIISRRKKQGDIQCSVNISLLNAWRLKPDGIICEIIG
jgi:hypothetical protein